MTQHTGDWQGQAATGASGHEGALCWYCGRRPAVPAHAAVIEMHKNVQRSFAGVTAGGYRTRVEWSSVSPVAPRCAECAGGHRATHRWSRSGLWLGILLGSPLWLLLFAASNGSGIGLLAGLIIGFPGSMLWGWWLARWIGERRAGRKGTQPFKAASSRFPSVAERLADGWSLGRPRGVR